jgi:hypothetical protein
MTTAMGEVTGATITVIKNGVAITMAMGMGGTDLDIGNLIPMLNQSMSHRQCTIRQCTILHSNRPASVCFFRLIFIDRYAAIRKFVLNDCKGSIFDNQPTVILLILSGCFEFFQVAGLLS